MKTKKRTIILAAVLSLSLAAVLAGCGAKDAATQLSSTAAETATIAASDVVSTSANTTSGGAIDTTDLFTERDLEQTADLTDATYYTVSDGQTISIITEGVYVISGTASNAQITVEAGDEDKVQLVLDGVSITNDSTPAIYFKNADKVFVTTTEGSSNSLSVSGTFTADGDTNTDGVIFSKDDLVLNGLGTLNISSSDNAVVSKDDLKVTGGTYEISCSGTAFEANDSIAVADGTFSISNCNDGLHAENDEDDSVGYVYICGGSFNISAADDGIHATTIFQMDDGDITISAAEAIEGTWVQFNGGTVDIEASDDGINASSKSSAYSICAEFNGGNITINMGAGDTDAIDSNGDLIINGGTITINAQSPFDYDGTAQKNGGTLIINGTETDSITNQMMGGGPMGGMPGSDTGGQQGGFDGGQMGGGPQGGMGGPGR
ncbi:MAG: carbohydrate-binding domain-containing protein [Lachnospiraceae bacterium]|nr:carbohydrate-binding domain-containing protein [Lachnospiraceae bacterium]